MRSKNDTKINPNSFKMSPKMNKNKFKIDAECDDTHGNEYKQKCSK